VDGEEAQSSGLHRAADRIESIAQGGQVWVAIAAAVALFLLQIPGIETLASHLGVESNPHLRTVVSLILLTSILLELRQLKRTMAPARTDRIHYSDPQDMYAALSEKARAIADPDQRTLDVLGMTLYSAWPALSFMLQRPEINNWTIRLATLSKDAVSPRQWIPDDWPAESAANVRQVYAFAAHQGRDHGHRFEVIEYWFTPGVHGFRLGNGDLFISVLFWQEDGRLGKPGFTYDYVPSHDVSPGAAAMRSLFANWFERAVRSDSGDSPVEP
jgi:hypothetical protein